MYREHLTTNSKSEDHSLAEHSIRSNELERLLLRASKVILDLDHLLVKPNGLHRRLFMETVRSLGGDEEIARNSFIQNRGISYKKLLRMVFADCGGNETLGVCADDFAQQFSFVAKYIQETKMIGDANPSLCDGADMVAQRVASCGLPFKVCTGSLRAIAELEISLVGLDAYLKPKDLRCSDDTEFEKTEQRYWDELFEGHPPSTVLGFEDRVEPAEALLQRSIGQMIIVPRIHDQSVVELSKRYPGRVTVLPSLSHLF